MSYSEEKTWRTQSFLLFLFVLLIILAVLSLTLEASASTSSRPPAFVGSPTPPPSETPSPPVSLPHTIELLQDIYSGPESGSPKYLTAYNGEVFFAANQIDPYNRLIQEGLHKYCGGRVCYVTAFNPDLDDKVNYLTVYGDKLYLTADGVDSSQNPVGNELFSFDGNSGELVADLLPGSDSSSPFYLTVFDGNLYFTAEGYDDNSQHVGRELFKYDGSTVSLALDIIPGSVGSDLFIWGAIDQKLYFRAKDNLSISPYALYSFDGTTLNRIFGFDYSNWLCGMWEYQGEIYIMFCELDQNGSPVGFEFSLLNGDQLTLVANFPQGSNPGYFTEFAGKLYFRTNMDGTSEINIFDGSTFQALTDLYPWPGYPPYWSEYSANPGWLYSDGNVLYFYGAYYDMFTNAIFQGLYRFDLNRVEFIDKIKIYELLSHNGDLYIAGDDLSGIGYELWRLTGDSSKVTNTQITSINPSPSQPGEAVRIEVLSSTSSGLVPSAIVDIGDGKGNNCQAIIVSGVGGCDLTFPDYGEYEIYARFELGTEYLSSSDETLHVVAPASPTGLSASDGEYPDKIAVSWAAVSGATEYLLGRATTENGEIQQVYYGPGLSFDDAVSNYADYYYFISACYSTSCSKYSNAEIGYIADKIFPTGSFITPPENGKASRPRTILNITANDNFGIKSVTYWAHYDDAWHQLHTDTDASDGWKYQWATVNIPNQIIKVKAEIVDLRDNMTPVQINNVFLADYHTSIYGYQARNTLGTNQPAEVQDPPSVKYTTFTNRIFANWSGNLTCRLILLR